jgi:hypothetical protein
MIIFDKLFSTLICLGLPMSAYGDFVGISVEDITQNDDGLKEYAIYCVFDDPSDLLISVGGDIGSTTGFYHSSVNGMKSALPWTAAENALSNNPDVDSFVTIGLTTGDNNITDLLPSFSEADFFEGNSLGNEAQWVALSQTQGLAGSSGKVLIAVFAPTNDLSGRTGIVSGELVIGYMKGGTTSALGFDSFTTVPAPAVCAALVLCPLVSRRRR